MELIQDPWFMFAIFVYVSVKVYPRLVKQPEHVEGGVTSGMAFPLRVDILLDTLPHKILDDTDVFKGMTIFARQKSIVRLIRSQAVTVLSELSLIVYKNAVRFVHSNRMAREFPVKTCLSARIVPTVRGYMGAVAG